MLVEREESMVWQSVEELEAEKDSRRTESKEDRMRRKGLEALRNIEEATRKKNGLDGSVANATFRPQPKISKNCRFDGSSAQAVFRPQPTEDRQEKQSVAKKKAKIDETEPRQSNDEEKTKKVCDDGFDGSAGSVAFRPQPRQTSSKCRSGLDGSVACATFRPQPKGSRSCKFDGSAEPSAFRPQLTADKKRKQSEVEGKTKLEWQEKKPQHENIKTLVEIVPEGVNALEETQEWEEIEMAVDSGATETVIAEDMVKSVETQPGEAMKKGVRYEVASGDLIPNLGEKCFTAVGEEGQARSIKAQVCDVNKALLSVHRMVQAGNTVVFSKHGSYAQDDETGEKMYMREQGGMYMIKMWVRNPSFRRQAEQYQNWWL